MKLRYLKIWMLANVLASFFIGYAIHKGTLHLNGGALTVIILLASWITCIVKWPAIKHEYRLPAPTRKGFSNLRELKLIEEDFITLDIHHYSFPEQLTTMINHPVAKALQRHGFDNAVVSNCEIIYDNITRPAGESVGLDAMRQTADSLRWGDEFVIIKL